MTSLVPSGNVASTWTSGSSRRRPSIDVVARQERRAVAHQLGHVRPSRAPSRIAAEMKATASG